MVCQMRSSLKLFLVLLLLGAASPSRAQEIPNFSILLQAGGSSSQGFLGNGGAAPEGGLWLGIGLSDRFDGMWGMDYYSMPSQVVTVDLPSRSNPVSFLMVQPSDDFALTVNTRWYTADKYDFVHQRFNTVPYLIAGFGMDLVIDQLAPISTSGPPPTTNFYNKSYDVLFSLNLGLGMDFPLDHQWFIYTEGLDHLIAWQELTQIVSIRAGVKVMLDSAHVDPFR